ncbi:Leucine-rich repeat containing protein [Entamoeba marina]
MDNTTRYDLTNKGYKTSKSFPKDVVSNASVIIHLDVSGNGFVFTKHFKSFSSLTTLRAGNNKISKFPIVICEFSLLKTLRLSNNEITEIPSEISMLHNLEDLNLSHNRIKSIPLAFESLTRLKILNLSVNYIETVPKVMSKLNSVSSLNLSTNEFKVFPFSVSQMPSLTYLSVADNKIVDVTAAVSELTNLRRFDLQRNLIETIPIAILASLTKLTSLNITDNPITELAPLTPLCNLCSFSASLLNGVNGDVVINSLSTINTLDAIYLSNCSISTFPSLVNQTNLTTLSLVKNTIDTIQSINSPCECDCSCNGIKNFFINSSDGISSIDLSFNSLQKTPNFLGVKSIKNVNISFNFLTHISNETFHTSIINLNIAGNPLVTFPSDIIMCTGLTNLNISDCHLYDLPTECCSYLCNIKIINVSLNSFSEVKGLSELKKLEEIILSSNNLISFPTELITLSHLKKLCVSNNNIKVIPSAISFLSSLESVDFSSNKLFSYEPLLQCHQLKEVQLSYNLIASINPILYTESWKKLEIFDIVGNPIENINTLSGTTKRLLLVNATISHRKKIIILICHKLLMKKILTKSFHSIANNSDIKTKKGSSRVALKLQEELDNNFQDIPLFDDVYEIDLGCSQTRGFRPKMEDTFCLGRKLFGSAYIVGVFDGHGGIYVSRLCSTQFVYVFLKLLNGRIDDISIIEDCLISSYSKLNEKARKLNLTGGSTGLVYFVHNNIVYVANCGDCRAILVKNNSCVQLTNDHKPITTTTKDVIRKKFWLCEAIGNFNLQPLIKSTPEVKHFPIEEDDMYIISASDGVWDVLDNEEVASIARIFKNLSTASIATIIRDKTISKNSQDNITVTVFDLEYVK